MAYSFETKSVVINQIRQGMAIKEAVRTYGISRWTIKHWLKSPPDSLCKSLSGKTRYDIELKVEVLRFLEESNLSIRQVAILKNINRTTIHAWIKDKPRILAVYSSQGQHCTNAGQAKCPGEEAESMGTADDKDENQHIRALKDENQYLKARVAYLEALMELKGTPASGIKKKPDTKPSTESSEKGSET